LDKMTSETFWINPRYEQNLINRIINAQVCVSDLDDTDALSPAKKIGLDFGHFGKHFGYWSWIFKTGIDYLSLGKNAESQSWKGFVERFLRNPQELQRIVDSLNPTQINSSLFSGVKEFYHGLSPQCYTAYITRNIQEVTSAYAKFLGISETFSEAYDKRRVLENLVDSNPQHRRWIIKGDSDEDKEMLEYLRFKQKNHDIESVVGIKVDKSKPDQNYDLTLFRDYRDLVRMMRNSK